MRHGIDRELEDILKRCDRRMLIYMAKVIWQDRISSEEVVKSFGLKLIQNKLRQTSLQWFGHVRRETEGGVFRLVEEMKVLGGEESSKTKENLKRYIEERF